MDSASSKLFSLLDATLLADKGPAGFEAKIAVGVMAGQSIAWWIGELGADKKTPSTSRSSTTPVGCSAMIVLGIDETKRIVEGQSFPRFPRVFKAFGDAPILERFRSRYLDRKSVLGVRAAQMGGQ